MKLNTKKYFIIFIITIIILLIIYKTYKLILLSNDKFSHTMLYPPIKPLQRYKLKVSDIHTVYYSTFGNKDGKPVLILHGGPGSALTDEAARFFNPSYYYIVLVDQRGSGKSEPNGELRENTTQNLIEDFEKIRKSLNIKKWLLFGGSWGSTLSLAYAISHSDIITGMILRGIFLQTNEEIEWIYSSNENAGLKMFNPQAWDYFKNTLPQKDITGNYIKDYKRCFNGDFGETKKEECLLGWDVLEGNSIKLKFQPLNEYINNLKKNEYTKSSLIENYYMVNHFFLEPNYFLNPNNINKIKNIPTIIVNGKYDLVCPPKTAYKLHKLLTNSKLYITLAGHTIYDDENIKYLVKATNEFMYQ